MARRITRSSSSLSIPGRPRDLRCAAPSNFRATSLRCQPRIVSGWATLATSASACLRSCRSRQGWCVRRHWMEAPFDLSRKYHFLPRDTRYAGGVPGRQNRDIGKQGLPIHGSFPSECSTATRHRVWVIEGQKTSRRRDDGRSVTSCDLAHFYFLAIHHIVHWRLDGEPRTARRYTTYRTVLPTQDRLLFILVT